MVIARFLQRFGSNRGQPGVDGPLQSAVHLELPAIDQPLAHDGPPKVAIRLFGEREIGKLRCIAEERESVLVTTAPFDLASVAKEQACLANMIQREVSQPEVLFQRRRVTNPLA